ncbi:MAG: serine/threonine protein kinase, partial [Deltaproteobacteria bacterium]|nr:serine/threonine protein kinase [Deltaproteobacteria bacterium]
MPQPRYTVDLADAGRLRRMSGEFLERGLCPVRASQLPAVEAEVILVLQLPGAATLEVPGQVVRLIPGRGFVARLDRTRAAPVLEAVRALLQGPSPEPSPSPSGLRDGTRPWEDAADAVDPLGGTILHPSATQGAPPASSAPDAAPTEAELVVLEKVQPKGRRSLVGQVLEEKYKVVRLLGQGGMGEVYEATHRYLEKRVALKVLLPDLARDPAFVTRFLREARSVSGLTSPHTVKVHDFGASSDGTLYFTMDLLEGRPLTRVIDEEAPLPFSRAAAIILQACHSLGEAHAAGLLHRDIKPDNLFVSRGPNGIDHVTLLDFGIVRPVSGGERLTVTGTICGTPHYLSPEQAQGKDLDIRSDLYSLGVILYEMLTGVCPFDADNTVAVLMKQIQELPPPLTAAYPDLRIDPRVDELLSAILAKDPARRPPTAAALADALRKVAEDIGLPIPGEPTRSRRAEPAAAARHRERWAPPPPADKARRTLLRIPGPSRFGLPPWAGYLLSALFVLLVLALW